MKKTLGSALRIFLLVSLTSGIMYLIMFSHFTGRFPWEPDSSDGAIHSIIHSVILKEDREIIIHLPPGYDSTSTYPVMYVLDGGSEDRHIANKFDILSAVGFSPQTVVVGIPNMTAENRRRNLIPPFMHVDSDDATSPMGEGDQFLLFMETELFPFIEKNYTRSHDRLFTGNSRGGLLVMYSLLSRPELFKARFCYSTPFWREDDILISRISDFLTSTDSLTSFLYMSAGEKETDNIKDGLSRMRKVFQDRVPKGLVWYSDIIPNTTHQNNATVSSSIGIERWSDYVHNSIASEYADGKHN